MRVQPEEKAGPVLFFFPSVRAPQSWTTRTATTTRSVTILCFFRKCLCSLKVTSNLSNVAGGKLSRATQLGVSGSITFVDSF